MQHVTGTAAFNELLRKRPSGTLTHRAWHNIKLKRKCLLSEHFLLVALKSMFHIAKV